MLSVLLANTAAIGPKKTIAPKHPARYLTYAPYSFSYRQRLVFQCLDNKADLKGKQFQISDVDTMNMIYRL